MADQCSSSDRSEQFVNDGNDNNNNQNNDDNDDDGDIVVRMTTTKNALKITSEEVERRRCKVVSGAVTQVS